MDKNYRRDAAKKREAAFAAENYVANATAELEGGNSDDRKNRKYDRPKRLKYKTKINKITFDKRCDYMAAMSILSDASFNILSIPVYMNINQNDDRTTIIGHIDDLEITMEGEAFAITVNERFIEQFKAIEASKKLEMMVKALIVDGQPVKLLSFEVKAR